MSEMKYTEDHEWVRLEENNEVVLGITDYAQEQLGEIVFVELPAEGDEVEQGTECAVIESVKAAGELKAPVSGVVLEVNTALADEPELINNSAIGDGWFIRVRIKDEAGLEDLMDQDAYEEYLATLD